MFNKIKTLAKAGVQKVKNAFSNTEAVLTAKAHDVLDGTVAEGYVDTAIKILIAVVLGALLIGLLYVLFNDTVMPTVQTKVEELFEFAG